MTSGASGFGDFGRERPEATVAEEEGGYRSSFVEQVDSCYDLALIPEDSETRSGVHSTSSSELNINYPHFTTSGDNFRFET
jgi:hypothetical protein